MNRRGLRALVVILSTITAPAVFAQDDVAGHVSPAEISSLKTQLAEQQKQIEQLRAMLEEQKKLIEAKTPEHVQPYNLGQVTSTTPVLPRPLAPAVLPGAMPVATAAMPQKNDADTPGPLQLRLGNAFISPVGFMDMTSITRSTNPGTGIGTNFASIPYGNTQAGALSESRLSPQNSRIGMRIDTGFHGYNVMGYWESDFLGQLGAPPNGALAVTSNPYVFRLRLYWVNVNKGKFDFLAGQSWSLMTPNRKGISPIPGDIFYSQDIDVNYQLGLVWGRIPGFRAVYHPTDKVAFAVALENSEPYVGGGNGGSAIVGPAAIYGTPNPVSGAVLGGQINNGNSVISAAALHPDIIAKLAFDPSSRFHFEIAGVEITNKFANPVSTPAFQTTTKVGGGGSVNFAFDVVKNFRILTNNYWSAGGGRYIFGEAPDFMIRANGDLSLIRSGSTVTGFEATAGKTLFYGYYGGVYIAKNNARDTNGALIGYGGISSDGQNRAIQEITFGTNTTLAKDAKWGALNLMFQYSYLQRNPWFAAVGAPSNASLSMGFFNLRYTLPGAPAPKREYQ
jgi:hypothetical protein